MEESQIDMYLATFKVGVLLLKTRDRNMNLTLLCMSARD